MSAAEKRSGRWSWPTARSLASLPQVVAPAEEELGIYSAVHHEKDVPIGEEYTGM